MPMGNFDGAEKRQKPRVMRGFVVKFRTQSTEGFSNWQVSTLQNISLGGCCFYSSAPYKIGEALEVLIQLPNLKDPMRFSGVIRRCEIGKGPQASQHLIGVEFTEMDGTKKTIFIQTLEFFLKK